MKNTSIEIIKILKENGHQAYWAGGCVRDMLLGIRPQDFDIATSATPQEISNLLEHTIPIGKKFGVMVAILNGHRFEIATFRTDLNYRDGRRPDSVKFTNAQEDALRRDFTINAIFYDPLTDEIIDYIDGQKDLRERLIRFIGDPQKRIKEDHLRILRAVRLKNSYKMQYHPATYQAIHQHVKLVKKISKERVRDEFNKIIMGANASKAFEELYEISAIDCLIPEMSKLKGLAQPLEYHHEGDVWDHSLKSLESLLDEEHDSDPLPDWPPTLALKWATLLHDIGKFDTFSADDDRIRYNRHSEVGAEIAQKILTRLKFSKKIIERVCFLIAHHMMVYQLFEMSDGRKRHWFLKEGFTELLELYRADAMGIDPLDLSDYHKLKKMYRKEIGKLKLKKKKLISGKDVMKILGPKASPGPLIGQILDDIYHLQLEGKIQTEEDAKNYVRKLK